MRFRVLFLLMNKDTKWLLFDCYEDEFGFVAGKEIEWYTESRPIGYDNIGDFLDARKAPKHRKHIAELLKKYGCESIENFLKLTHALSLNDTFWVKQPESTLSWNDVSLYRNEFDELVSNAAFDGVISSTTLSSTSPEFGTDGAYAKCWQRENGTAYLYKSGSDTYEIEPLSEYLATQVADILCRNNAKYELTFYHGRLASKCKLFTSERFGLVKLSALPVSNRRNPAAFLKFAEQYGSEDLMRRRNRNQYGGGYNYNSTEVLGFPQIHNWVLAGLTLMPTTGNVDPTLGEGHWKSHFRHEGEIAQPGYHRLFLEDYGIWVEQTATDRTGFYRLTFTRDAEAGILLNLGGYLASTTMCNARVRRVGEHEIEGSFDTYGRHWGGPENVRVYFVVRFDRPFDRLDGWAGTRRYSGIDSLEGSSEITRRHPREALSYLDSPTSGVAAYYGVRTGDRIHVRTVVSYVSTENARENLTHDATTWDFDAVRRAAQDEWNEWLGRIEVKGGTQQQRTKFYTDLWHVLLGRHKIDDVNGEYPDLTDGQRAGSFTRDIRVKTRTLPRDAAGRVVHHMYNSDAFWLTQWNLNVLWGLGWPEMPDEMSASLIRYADNGGLIPRGPCAGGYTYIMSGCPATPLIVSAYNKGLMRKCDPMHAFRTMQRNHMPGGMQGIGEFYLEHGYQPKNAGMTIESNFQDWALAQMAVRLGLEDEAAYFGNRSHGWRKLYRPDQQLLFPKDEQGQWLHDDPLRGTGWIEANAWQATWGVSHELPALATLMGGYDKFCEKLNYAFEQAAPQDFVFGYGQGYVSYANQPGCSNAHVFSWGGKPWLTQYWVRRVNEQAYGAITPDRGYGGHDEDQGQMSSWFVMAALGLFQTLMSIGLFSTRGTAAARPVYEITSPVFDEVSIQLDKRYYPADRSDRFVIRTYGNSDKNCYIQRARLNGRVLNNFWFPHEEFARGGLLELWLGPEPNTRWGTGKLPE